jgi:hypothetical protein
MAAPPHNTMMEKTTIVKQKIDPVSSQLTLDLVNLFIRDANIWLPPHSLLITLQNGRTHFALTPAVFTPQCIQGLSVKLETIGV